MARVLKSVGFFGHLPHLSEAQCDRHYLDAHVPFVADMMRAAGVAHSYNTSKACAQRDVNGGWRQTPVIWRSVAIRLSMSETSRSLGEDFRVKIEEDHRRFLCNLRTYLCSETIMFEDLRRTPSPTKFIIEAAVQPGAFDGTVERAEAFRSSLEHELARPSDVILAISNRVRRQEVSRPLEVPGQGFTPGVFLDEATTAAIFELYFVSRRAGDAFFERLAPAIAVLEEADEVKEVRCFQLDEECQIEASGIGPPVG